MEYAKSICETKIAKRARIGKNMLSAHCVESTSPLVRRQLLHRSKMSLQVSCSRCNVGNNRIREFQKCLIDGCNQSSRLHSFSTNTILSVSRSAWLASNYKCLFGYIHHPMTMTMTMTLREVQHLSMEAWPYRHECRRHDTTKKNLLY